MKARILRIYADDAGESHLGQIEIDLERAEFEPPAPPVDVSAAQPAKRYLFVGVPAGWQGEQHTVATRQLCLCMRGRFAIETSDGQIQHFGPGDVHLGEDMTGRGHRTWVTSQEDVLLLFVQLPV
jgi:hypothetical protein